MLPPPPFPTQFNDSPPMALAESGPSSGWPAENEPVSQQPSRQVEWTLSTDSEDHLALLENRLYKLASSSADPTRFVAASTSNADSGYGSHPHYEHESLKLVLDNDADEDGAGDSEEEGRALLGPPQNDDCTDAAERVEQTPATSPSKKVLVIPATPLYDDDEDSEDETSADESDNGEEVEVYAQLHEQAENQNQNRRISFSSSVRISGGIRSKKSQHKCRRPPPFEDIFAPLPPQLPPNATATERSPLLPSGNHHTARNASLSSLASSRSASPSRIVIRNLSSSSLLPQHHAYPSNSVYSTSPTTTSGSGLPSRSSSPCSSIYAPLQPPKAHCPSPGFVRLTPKRKPPARAEGRGLSFADYLRGGRRAPDEEDEEAAETDENDEEGFRGYRELVDRQQRKREKERWASSASAKRRRLAILRAGSATAGDAEAGGGFWSRLTDLLAVRAIGAGSGRRGGVGVGGGYGSIVAAQEEPTSSKKPSSRRTTRRRSRLSISSASESEHSDDSSSSADEVPSAKPAQKPKSKSALDLRFGTAPGRWIRPAYWSWRMKEWWRDLESMLEGISAKEAAVERV